MNTFDKVMLYIVAGFFSVLFIIMLIATNHDHGYKNGQIDAINGIVKYHLVETKKENHEVMIIWEKIDSMWVKKEK